MSSDTTGHIIVWDVVAGNPRAVLQEGSKPVLGKEAVVGVILTWLHWIPKVFAVACLTVLSRVNMKVLSGRKSDRYD